MPAGPRSLRGGRFLNRPAESRPAPRSLTGCPTQAGGPSDPRPHGWLSVFGLVERKEEKPHSQGKAENSDEVVNPGCAHFFSLPSRQCFFGLSGLSGGSVRA